MPIINHDIQRALRVAGIVKDDNPTDTGIQARLDRHNLSLDETLAHLSDLVTGSDTSAVKLRAVDTILKLHGILKETAAPPPSINIIINDSLGTPVGNGINPILIPRRESVQ